MPKVDDLEAAANVLHRQEQLASDLTVVDHLDDMLEKGIIRRLLRRGGGDIVRSQAGKRKYGQEIGEVITRDKPEKGKGRAKGKKPTRKPTGAQAEPDLPIDPDRPWTAHISVREKWGTDPARAGDVIFKKAPNGKWIPSTPNRRIFGKWIDMARERGVGNPMTANRSPDYFGEWTVDEYVQGLKEGQFDNNWFGKYNALWITKDKIHAVGAHDQHPLVDTNENGDVIKMSTTKVLREGWLQGVIMSRHEGQGLSALTDPMLGMTISLPYDYESKTGGRIVLDDDHAVTQLMKQLHTTHSAVTVSFVSQHNNDFREAAGGKLEIAQAPPTLNKSFRFDTFEELRDFLASPWEIPPKDRDRYNPDGTEKSKEEQDRPSTYRGMRALLEGAADPERLEADSAYRRRRYTRGGEAKGDQAGVLGVLDSWASRGG